MRLLLSTILVISAICIFIFFIVFNRNRAREKDLRGITWSNIKRQTDIIRELNGGVGAAHIDQEYAEKKFKQLDKRDKIISVISVIAFFLIVLSLFLLFADEMI